MMFGQQPGRLLLVVGVDIHGALFYDLNFVLDATPNRVLKSRIGRESVYENPQAGDLVSLHLVMGQVTRVEKRAP
jgi:hypothetical protein